MKISSAPKRGCIVQIELPLPRRRLALPWSPDPVHPTPQSDSDPAHLVMDPNNLQVRRKVALEGFHHPPVGTFGLERLGSCLDRQFKKLGCDIVPLQEAELVFVEGKQEESQSTGNFFAKTKAIDIVFLVGHSHEAHPAVKELEKELGKEVRRFPKPATPSILRESLFPDQSAKIQAVVPTHSGEQKVSISAPDQIDSHGDVITENVNNGRPDDGVSPSEPANLLSIASQAWKPKGMPVEDAVANLSLGDNVSAHRRVPSGSEPSFVSAEPPRKPSLLGLGLQSAPLDVTSHSDQKDASTEDEASAAQPIKVLVVEDNMVNRKILVKILSSQKVSTRSVSESDDSLSKFARPRMALWPWRYSGASPHQ